MTIELLHTTKDGILANFGELWILVAICLLAYFTIVNMILQDPTAAFLITLIPLSLLIAAGILSSAIASYMLIALALILTLAMARLFLK